MISKNTKNEILRNVKKNDAARNSNERLIAMLCVDFNIADDEYATDEQLASMSEDLLPILAEGYNCTLEEGRQGLKFVGKKDASARKAKSRILGYFKAPVISSPFEKAKKAINAAIEAGLTEKQADELIGLLSPADSE
tara:strand:+ start:10324 stop:10737 length:414 start_codon:yes stop_codon:yes gene_type:complete